MSNQLAPSRATVADPPPMAGGAASASLHRAEACGSWTKKERTFKAGSRYLRPMMTSYGCELSTTVLLLVIRHDAFQTSFLVNSLQNREVCCPATAKGGYDGAIMR